MSHLPYYYGSLSAAEADEIMKNKPTGTYLLRESSMKQYSAIFNVPYTITWVEDISENSIRRVWHMRIEKRNNRFNLEDEVDSFPSIEQLIKYYSIERYPLSPKCYKPLLASLQQLSVNTINNNNIHVPIKSLKRLYRINKQV